MARKNILVVLGLAGVALILAGSTYFVRRDASPGHIGFSAMASVAAQPAPAAPAEGATPPVIRFVKNPEVAPPMQAEDILGKPVTKADWDGKVVLVNFWATWCPPCRMEIPELLELKKEYGDRLEIIGISEDDDPPAKVLKFAKSVGMTYPIVMYTPELVASYGGVPALPTSFLIDTKGRVVQKHSGLYPIEVYQQEIRALLGMPIEARVETFVDQGQIFLKNAANATELPGVSFKGLTAEQKKGALHRMNAETCTCGCGLTVSQCRVNDSECPTSKGIAAQMVKDAANGVKPPAEPAAKGTKSITQ
jgi:thiol-disulfide isomerase/thioredoxin